MADPKTMTKYELANQAGAGLGGSPNNEKYSALLLAKCTDDLESRLDGLTTAIENASDAGNRLTRWVQIASIVGAVATVFQAFPAMSQCLNNVLFWLQATGNAVQAWTKLVT
ncbi:MAG: hypothetical protein K2X29_08350 [Candidatus Obscuribacterales bacterium]|nr:hypothetical protein [Candidatus Obscuribacterales bacterium]